MNTTSLTSRAKQSQGPLAVDLFCGAGGFSLGFEQAGFRVAVAVDSSKVHTDAYRKNFPGTAVLCADIRALDGPKILEFGSLQESSIDVVFGGPPCQGFSVAGKRRVSDRRNSLLGEFLRVAIDLRPKIIVLENVQGLLLRKRLIDSAFRVLRRSGYEVVTPIRVLNALNYGVPQRRKRVFIIAHRIGTSPPDYPRPTNIEAAAPTVWEALGDLAAITSSHPELSGDVFSGRLLPASAYARAMRRGNGGRPLTGCLFTDHSQEVTERFNNTTPGTLEPVSRAYRLHPDGFSRTLRAGTDKGFGKFTAVRPVHPTEPRCLTVREAARLHSFPDWFSFGPNRWQGFMEVGNSVPPRLAVALARSLKRTLAAAQLLEESSAVETANYSTTRVKSGK